MGRQITKKKVAKSKLQIEDNSENAMPVSSWTKKCVTRKVDKSRYFCFYSFSAKDLGISLNTFFCYFCS